MSVAVGATSQAEWYLARDGEQFGPLSDAELRKLVEMGHLKSSDLLWREGFPEWRSARLLLPEAGAPKPSLTPLAVTPVAAQSTQAAPVAQPQPPFAQPQSQTPAPQSAAAPYSMPAAPSVPTVDASATHLSLLAQRATDAAHAAMQSGPAAVALRPSPPNGPAAQQVRANVAARPQHGGQQVYASHGAGPTPQAATYSAAAYPHARSTVTGHPTGGLQPAAPLADPRAPDAGRSAPRLGPQAAAPRRKSAAPVVGADFDDEEERPRTSIGRWMLRVAVLLFFVATLSAAAWLAYPYRERILASAAGLMPAGLSASAKSPLVGFAATPEATDSALQSAPLWRTLKREFPDWYAERINEASALAREQKPERVIGEQMMTAVVALRRKHAGDALSATSAKLKVVAAAFAENLGRLRKTSVDACHGFISAGETSPAYLKMLDDPAHTGALQAQLTAVFDAVGEGRKVPRIYPQPKQTDYNLLVALLEARGWNDADMQLFSDSRAFGKAEPEKVCKMVTDWFETQLEIKDADAQLRLLADALKPVVAG